MAGQKRNQAGSSTTSAKKDNQQSSKSMFLIDGLAPIQPNPMILANKNYSASMNRNARVRGRQRSLDLKGLILELIDEVYPPLICPDCHEYSQARSDAEDHLKSFHPGAKVFSCASPVCEQKYSSRAGLRYHLEHGHTVTALNDKGISISKRSSRPLTPKSTYTGSSAKSTTLPSNNSSSSSSSSNKYNLPTEIQQKLDVQYPLLTCPACSEKFSKKTHVIKHLVDHHYGEEPYKCVVEPCKRAKTYATREGLLYHLANYHQ